MNAVEIVEALIVRDPQPNDVIVLRAKNITAEVAQHITDIGERKFGCRVIVLSAALEVVEVES